MTQAIDHAYFTRKMFLKSVLPAPLAAIGLSLAEMGDTILVGHAIGMDGLAAIGFVSPLFLVASFFLFGLSMGGAIVYSNLMHMGEKEKALGVFNFFLRLSALIGFGIAAGGIFCQEELLHFLGTDPEDGIVYEMTRSYLFYILLGIPFEILMEVFCSYLRNDDADAFSIAIQTASGVGNLILSALLLFFFDWGVAGCSFGFFFSNFMAALAAFAYILLRSDGELALCRKTITLREAAKPLRLGFSTSSEYVFDAIFTLVFIHMLADMAGTDGVAVFNVIENMALLFVFLFEFIGKTSQPLFSTFFAECNFAELRRVFRYALAYSLLMGVLATALVTLCPQILNLLFGLEDVEDVSKVYYAARVFCVGTIFMGICLLLQNYTQSEEDEKSAFLVVFLRRLGTGIPLAFLLQPYGFYALWMVYPLAELLTLLTTFLYRRRRGAKESIDPSRVYAASFLGRVEDVDAELDKLDAFAASRGADKRQRYTLRLIVEEVCGFMADANRSHHAPASALAHPCASADANRSHHAPASALAHPCASAERTERGSGELILTQLTLIAKDGGEFQLHLRNNGEEADPFEISRKHLESLSQPAKAEDFQSVLLQVAKTRARQFLYRNYHGFNTMTITI